MANNAITAAREQSKHGPRFSPGMCLREVRELFEIAARDPSAVKAWEAAATRYAWERDFDQLEQIPRGVPIFWSGGSQGHGHIAVATGHGGMCWSPDTKRPGYFDKVHITDVTRWMTRGRFLGFTLDVNGVRVPFNPKELPR